MTNPGYVLKPVLEALRNCYDNDDATGVSQGRKVVRALVDAFWPNTPIAEVMSTFSHRLREPMGEVH